MNSRISIYSCFFIPIVLAGCAGITQTQDAVTHFDQAAHTALDAEAALLKSEQTIDIDTQFYDAALTFSTNGGGNFDVTANYQPRQITAQQFATRNALMSAIGLYADKMQALAVGTDDTTLDTNSTSVAKNIAALAKAGNISLSPGNTTDINIVEAGINEIVKLALDSKKSKELKDAATSIQPALSNVVSALENENKLLAKNIGANLGKMESNFRAITAVSHDGSTSGSQNAQTFFFIVMCRQLLHSDSLIASAVSGPGGNAPINYVSIDYGKAANDALDAVLSGNDTIAKSGTAGIYASATNIYQRAKDAQSFYNGLSGTK